MPFYLQISTNINSTTRHLRFSYISILTNLLRTDNITPHKKKKEKKKKMKMKKELSPASCFHRRYYQAYYCSDDINK